MIIKKVYYKSHINMTIDRETTSLANPTARELVSSPEKEILFIAQGRTTGSVAQTRRRFLELVNENPTAIRTAIAAVYYHPEIFSPEEPQTVNLAKLRETFPTVISIVSEEALTQALRDNPRMLARVAEEKAILEEAGENEDIKGIELVLKLLWEDGTASSLTSEDYQNVISSQAAYQEIIKVNQGALKPSSLPINESTSLVELAQNILKSRRLFELQADRVDSEYKLDPATRSADYQGKLSQLRLISLLVGSLRTVSADNAQVPHLRATFLHLMAQTQYDHPDRFRELQREFNIPDVGKMSRWLELPEEPTLTQGERISFLNAE